MKLRAEKPPTFVKASASAKAMADKLVGRGNFCRVVAHAGIRRLTSQVTPGKTPEYATLEGLKHRDSPQYVAKKICSLQARRFEALKGGYWRI